jgi:hypothetical protein
MTNEVKYSQYLSGIGLRCLSSLCLSIDSFFDRGHPNDLMVWQARWFKSFCHASSRRESRIVFDEIQRNFINLSCESNCHHTPFNSQTSSLEVCDQPRPSSFPPLSSTRSGISCIVTSNQGILCSLRQRKEFKASRNSLSLILDCRSSMCQLSNHEGEALEVTSLGQIGTFMGTSLGQTDLLHFQS